MIHMTTFIAIVCVGLTTYLTRILGYLLLKNRHLSKRTTRILQVIPGCVILPYYAFVNKVGSCYSTVHQTGTQTQKSCEFDQTEILQQYKDMNMDVLNGKNFTYQMLKSKAES